MNGCAPGLGLIERLKATRKWDLDLASSAQYVAWSEPHLAVACAYVDFIEGWGSSCDLDKRFQYYRSF